MKYILSFFSITVPLFFLIVIGILGMGIEASIASAEGRLPDDWRNPIEKVAEFQEPIGGEDSTEKLNTLFRENIIPLAKFIFIGVGLLFLGLYAYQMALGMGEEDQLSANKSNILFAALGFSLIGIAGQMVEIINPIREGDTSQILDQDKTNDIVQTVINFLEIGLGSIAILMLFYGGIRLITANGDEERLTESKNIMLYGFMGFVIVMLADPLITEVFYPQLGSTNPGQDQAETFVQQGFGVLKFVLQFLGAIIFIAFIYAAFQFLIAGTDEEKTSNAKRTLLWTMIGFIVILISYSIVMFFIPNA